MCTLEFACHNTELSRSGGSADKPKRGPAAFAPFAGACRIIDLPSRSSGSERRLVPQDRIELSTYPLPRGCATTTLLRQQRPNRQIRADRCYRPCPKMTKEDWSRTAVAGKARDRNARLAQALKQNLKRRKASPAAGTAPANASQLLDAPGQKGLSPPPGISPKTASKRN